MVCANDAGEDGRFYIFVSERRWRHSVNIGSDLTFSMRSEEQPHGAAETAIDVMANV